MFQAEYLWPADKVRKEEIMVPEDVKSLIADLVEKSGKTLDRRVVETILLRWRVGGLRYAEAYLRTEAGCVFGDQKDRDRLLVFVARINDEYALEAIDELLNALPRFASPEIRRSASFANPRTMECGCPIGYHSDGIGAVESCKRYYEEIYGKLPTK